jgi:hypothetical protein
MGAALGGAAERSQRPDKSQAVILTRLVAAVSLVVWQEQLHDFMLLAVAALAALTFKTRFGAFGEPFFDDMAVLAIRRKSHCSQFTMTKPDGTCQEMRGLSEPQCQPHPPIPRGNGMGWMGVSGEISSTTLGSRPWRPSGSSQAHSPFVFTSRK